MERIFKEPIYVTRPLLPSIKDVQGRLEEVWEKRWVTNNGPQHSELEKILNDYLQTEVSLFSNGTLALILGLKALNLSGEVITTPFTFPATTHALHWNNLDPVFCDINSEDLNINPDKIEDLITEKTSAILGVHVFGNPCNVEKIEQIAKKYNLRVIYDGAHAFGAKINGTPITHFGDITMFSFHATKLFNTIEGGAITFTDRRIGDQLSLLKNFGLSDPVTVQLPGINAKMNEIQAGIGLEVFKLIERERENRKYIKDLYQKYLNDIPGIRIVTNHNNEESSYQYFVIEINEEVYGKTRDWVHKELEKYNVFSRRYFYPLCSEFDWYKEYPSAQKENLPVANKIIKQVLSLPFYGDIEVNQVIGICDLLRDFYNS